MRTVGPTDHLVAGAVGEPGRRTFLIEIGVAGELEWFLVEKQQVVALAQRSLELLEEMGRVPTHPGPELGVPGEPTFRVTDIAIGIDGEDAMIVLSPDPETGTPPVAVTVSAERLGAMALRALEVVAAGRPECRFCGLPLDPDGHACPAANGDRRDR